MGHVDHVNEKVLIKKILTLLWLEGPNFPPCSISVNFLKLHSGLV